MPDKCVLILLDGLGDRSHACLGGLTPLQAARTPTLDRLAAGGSCGLYHAGILGQALPSENAHFAMFGYDLSEFPGRGPLEALGAGIDLGPKDVALLAHISCVAPQNSTLIVRKESDTLPESDARCLMEAVAEYASCDVTMRFHQVAGVSGVLVMKGMVSPLITDTNLMSGGVGLAIPSVRLRKEAASNPETQNTAAALTDYLSWAYHRLRQHPVNITRSSRGLPPLNFVVTQRAGQLKQTEPLAVRYGLTGLSISSGLIYHGLCAYLGIDVIRDKDSGDPADDISRRLRLARDRLDHYDFIHVHTKAPDVAAHDKSPLRKQMAIEALDKGLARTLGPLADDPSVLLVVASDHSTPSAGPLVHSGETVPLLFYGAGVRCDAVRQFDEISAAAGGLGPVRGRELMYLILNHLDRAKLQGTLADPADHAYFPEAYEPFRLDALPADDDTMRKKEGTP